MTPSELLHIRLYNQLLAMHSLTEPREVVAWMGAMQAQALEMPKKDPLSFSAGSGAGGEVLYLMILIEGFS